MTVFNGLIYNASSGGSSGGNVFGPDTATDNAIARYDTTTGKLLQDSSASINDNGRITTGAGANGGIAFGAAGARVSDSNNDGRLDFFAGGSGQMDIVNTGSGYRLRYLGSDGFSVGNFFVNGTTVVINSDCGFGRVSAGVLKSTDGGNGITGMYGGGAAVASATALPLPTGRVFHVTGTTNITSITATNLQSGVVITLIFDGVLTFTDGNNLKLAGNFVTTADDTITLAYDGTNFYECSRSIN